MSDLKKSLLEKYNRMAEESSGKNPRKLRFALGYGDYTNYGYWTEQTKTGEEACDALMEKLLSRIPRKTGTILDVACGLAATTKYLFKHYPKDRVVGINLAEDQIEYCRRNVRGVRFEVMKAENLEFEDNSFDNIICVEAAFHFETRIDFLREALRVLKPSGHLVLSDILADVPAREMPEANRISNFFAYREVFEEAGFKDIEIEDATEQAVLRQTEVCWDLLQRLRQDGEVKEAGFQEVKRSLVSRRTHMTYALVSAVKP